MIRISSCKFGDLKQGIHAAFKDDTEGLDKYLDPVLTMKVESVEDGINEQYKKLKEYLKDGKKLINYLVYNDDILIGYFTYEINNKIFFLVSFGIAVRYRSSREVQADFFVKIESVLGKRFCCILWDKNTRAIRWLKKNGMIENGKTRYDDHQLSILIKK